MPQTNHSGIKYSNEYLDNTSKQWQNHLMNQTSYYNIDYVEILVSLPQRKATSIQVDNHMSFEPLTPTTPHFECHDE